MGLLSTALRAELSRATVRAHFVLEIGESIRLSDDPIASRSLGYYEPWIASWGSPTRRMSSFRAGLQASTLQVDVMDVGRQFSATHGMRLRGQAVTARIVSPEVAAADYFAWFVGVVDSVSRRGSTLTIAMRGKDDALTANVTQARFSKYMWPLLPSTADSGAAIPAVSGTLDSSGFAANGMVPCTLIDGTGYRYVVALTWDISVLRVFSGDVLKADGADYALEQALTGDGRKVTIIDFVADQGSAAVVADVQTPGRTGAAVPLKGLLRDLAYNDYHATTFADASAPIDAASCTTLDAALVTALGYSAAYYIPPGRVAGAQLVRNFNASFEALAYWTYQGALALALWEWRTQDDDVYRGPDAPDATLAQALVLDETDFVSEPEQGQDAEAVATRLAGRSGLRPADGTWLNARSVMIETGEPQAVADTDMPYLPATVQGIGSTAYLTPNATVSSTTFAAVGAATVHEAIDDPAPAASDGGTTYVEATSAGGAGSFVVDLSAMPALVTVASVTIRYEARSAGAVDVSDDDELRPYLVSGGADYAGEIVTGMTTAHYSRRSGGVWTVDPATGTTWTQAGLNAARIKMEWDPVHTVGKKMRISQAYLEVAYTAAADVQPTLLSVLSRRANRYRRAPLTFAVRVPLRFIDLELGTDLPIHSRPHGWGARCWEARLHRITGVQPEPATRTVRLELEDVHEQLCTFWLWGKALVGIDGSAAVGDGVALLTPGCTVTVTRAGVVNLDAPAGLGIQDGPVVQLLANTWPTERAGALIESSRTNLLTRSSFVSGTTGLTLSAGSGTIAADSTVGEQLFLDVAVTPQSLLFTAGAPHSTESRVTWATASVSANTLVVVSVDHVDSSTTAGDGLSWRLQRAIDSKYWRNSDATWQAGATDNDVTESATWARALSKVIDVGGSATTLTLSLSVPSGGTAGRTVRVGHVQIDGGPWASSRVVTNAATVTRPATVVSIDNDKSDGTTTWHAHPNKRGTWAWRVVPLFNGADVTTGTHYLYELSYSNGNKFQLYYDCAAGAWKWNVRVGGVDAIASVTAALVRGTEVVLHARWTSTVGELDLAAGTATLVVDGVEGSAVFGSAPPTFSAGKKLTIGSNAGGNYADMYIVEARLSPFCLDSDTIAQHETEAAAARDASAGREDA